MKKMIMPLCAAAAAAAICAHAQEFGAEPEIVEEQAPVEEAVQNPVEPAEPEVVTQIPDGAVEQDLKTVEDTFLPPKWESSKDKLEQYRAEKNIEPWDETTERLTGIETVKFTVKNPKISTDFVDVRSVRMFELLLRAKAALITAIYSNMSAERIKTIPGNPISKQMEKQEKELRKKIELAREKMESLGLEMKAAKDQIGKANIYEIFAILTDAVKASSASLLAQALDADKKRAYEDLKSEFESIKADYNDLVEKENALKDDLADNTKKTTTSKVALESNMQLHGFTVLKQADSVRETENGWEYEISVLWSWSPESQEIAEAILSGSEVKMEPRKHSVLQWLNEFRRNSALADWLGPRTYVDNKGNIWYLGIAASAVEDDDIDDEKSVGAAELEARAEVVYALYSQVATAQRLEKVSRDIKVGGTTETQIFKDYSEETREMFSNIQLSGLSKIGTFEITHPSTGQELHVSVFGINASLAKNMKNIRMKALELGLIINTEQEFMRGETKQINRLLDESRNNAEARAAGAENVTRDAAARLRARAEAQRRAAEAARKAAARESSVVAPKPASKGGQLKQSSRFVDDDDF